MIDDVFEAFKFSITDIRYIQKHQLIFIILWIPL